MSSLPGGPAYTNLRIGQTSVPGVIYYIFQGGAGGLLAARGNFPASNMVPNPSSLDIGRFQFAGSFFETGDAVTFDIAGGAFGPWAVNVQKV